MINTYFIQLMLQLLTVIEISWGRISPCFGEFSTMGGGLMKEGFDVTLRQMGPSLSDAVDAVLALCYCANKFLAKFCLIIN